MRIYCISGLGVDERMFGNLVFPPQYDVRYIHWISPLPGEAFSDYALRLSAQVDTSGPFQLVGLSFGGMLAVEWSKILKPLRAIIISSASVHREIPWYFRLSGRLIPSWLLPVGIMKSANFFSYWWFGARTTEEKRLLKQVLKDTDDTFLKWAVRVLLTWQNTERPAEVFHIHGAADKVLPVRYTNADMIIRNGSHLMVYSDAIAVSEVLKRVLK